MKSMMKSILGLQMAAMFLTVALAGPAMAAQQVPFKGSVQAVESYDVQFPTMFVDTTGTGEATHLGRFTVTWEFTVNLLNGAGIGSAHFIAANGDSVFTESLGQGDPTETPGINRVVTGDVFPRKFGDVPAPPDARSRNTASFLPQPSRPRSRSRSPKNMLRIELPEVCQDAFLHFTRSERFLTAVHTFDCAI